MSLNQQIREAFSPRSTVSLVIPTSTVREIDALVADSGTHLSMGGRSAWIRGAITERLARTKTRQEAA